MSVSRTRKHEERAGPPSPRGTAAAAAGNSQTTLSEEELRRMIAEAAYFHAAQRGFAPGGEKDDWLAAEREIRGALEAGRAARQPTGVAPVGPVPPRSSVPAETPPADATAR